MTKLYLVNNKVTYASGAGHWGDYAYILWEGFAPEDDEGRTYIERAGPFVPPLYMASSTLICTDAAKSILATTTSDLAFSAARKCKIVEIQWTEWDKDKEIDHYLDFDYIDSPADVIENGVHDPGIASSMPNLWRVEVVGVSKVKIEQLGEFNPTAPYSHLAFRQMPPTADFLLAQGDGYLGWFTSESGRNVLSSHFDDCLCFEEIPKL
jgi:hypothetical protein